jgi:hypothetical protein
MAGQVYSMLIPAGIVIILYGLAQIYLKDLWWWDHALLWQAFGKVVQRTETWDRDQDHLGLACIAAGVFLLVYVILL